MKLTLDQRPKLQADEVNDRRIELYDYATRKEVEALARKDVAAARQWRGLAHVMEKGIKR